MEKPEFYSSAQLHMLNTISRSELRTKITDLQNYITHLEQSKPKPKRYMTRDGRPVELITENGRGNYPKIGYLANETGTRSWTKNGEHNANVRTLFDLIEIKEPTPYLSQAIEDLKEQAKAEGVSITVIVE